jgi:pyridoxal phosphate enzyme (YggS family)
VSIAASLAQVQYRVAVALDAHVLRYDVAIVGVTKTVPFQHVRQAIDAGLTHVGENYAQEAVVKLAELRQSYPHVTRHFVGALQTNKIRQLVGLVDVWQSIDRETVMLELSRRSPGARVFIQVNVGDEPQKGGCTPDRCTEVVARARELGLAVEGLMTLGVAGDPSRTAAGFAMLRDLANAADVEALSMGMSDDLELAIAAGATHIRVGTALFGARAVVGADVVPRID